MNNEFSKSTRRLPALGWTAALCLTWSVLMPVQAQTVEGQPEFIAATQRWIDDALASARPEGIAPLRMEVVLGMLDSRLQLAPCAKVETYIPPGSRLWGKTRLGLRCLEGAARWNVFLPVTIRAFGSAWVIKGNVAPGAVLALDDAMAAEVDWADDRNAIMATPEQWVGQVATRALTTGQALRQGMTRAAQVFQAGTQVRVIAQGPGFQITADGQALTTGIVGQPARVRMEGGRIMSGVVLDSRTVVLDI
jgi:flagella basal body P-ring formation protein FlgA